MRRIQVHLEEELDEALTRQAIERGIPKAALIRDYLAQHVTKGQAGRRRPSEALIGVYEGNEDESDRIDDVLYGP